jgi:hypothetical protein
MERFKVNDRDWREFRERAMDVVREGTSRKRNREYRDQCIIQIIHEPSFDMISSVQLCLLHNVVDDSVSYCATRTTWDQIEDQRHFWEPLEQIKAMRLDQLNMLKPSIERTDMAVDLEFGRAVENRLRSVSLPLPKLSSRVGLDGERWTIRMGDQMMAATYTWWCNCPAEWTPLAEIVTDVWSF